MKHSTSGKFPLPSNTSRNVSVSSHDSTDWSSRRRLSYNQEEWNLMRSPKRENSYNTSVEESDDDHDDDLRDDIDTFLLTQQQHQQHQQQLKRQLQPRTMRMDDCLPTLSSPIDWLKKSLRSHSPGFLWKQQEQGGQRRHLFSDDEGDELHRQLQLKQEPRFDPTSPSSSPATHSVSSSSRQGKVLRLGTLSSSSEGMLDSPPPPPPPDDSSSTPPTADTRIIAPHVELLSLGSVVEVLLLLLLPSSGGASGGTGTGGEENVAVLCSVDVLKMHSRRFQVLLQRQETEASDLRVPTPLDEVWRSTLFLRDPSPFQAAAFLEHLHESRSVPPCPPSPSSSSAAAPSKADWNLAWARLSVEWEVENFRAAFSGQMSRHVSLVLGAVEECHWRLNPSVLLGRSVSVLQGVSGSGEEEEEEAQRGTGAAGKCCQVPTTRLGRVIQATSTALPHSSILVNFQAAASTSPSTTSSSTSSSSSCTTSRSEVSDSTDLAEEDGDGEQDGCLLSPAPPRRRYSRVPPSAGAVPSLASSAVSVSASSSYSPRSRSTSSDTTSSSALHPPPSPDCLPPDSFLAVTDPEATEKKRFVSPRIPLDRHSAAPSLVSRDPSSHPAHSQGYSHSRNHRDSSGHVRIHSDASFPPPPSRDNKAATATAAGNGVAATCCVEPFWVLSSAAADSGSGGGGSCWVSPDVFSRRLLDSAISAGDKQVFWEMIHALCTYPSLGLEKDSDRAQQGGEGAGGEDAAHHPDGQDKDCGDRPDEGALALSSGLPNHNVSDMDSFSSRDHAKSRRNSRSRSVLQKLLDPKQLAALLARVECRVLWEGGAEAAEGLLPVAVMKALVRASFCCPAPAPPSSYVFSSYSHAASSSSAKTLSHHSYSTPAPTDLRYSTRGTRPPAVAAACGQHSRSHSFHVKTEENAF